MIIMFKNVICCLASLCKELFFFSSARKIRVKTKTLRHSAPRAAYCYPRNRSEAETNPSWARRPTSTYWWSLVSSWWVCVWGGAAWWQPKRSTANWWTPSSPSWPTVCLPSTSGWVFEHSWLWYSTQIFCDTLYMYYIMDSFYTNKKWSNFCVLHQKSCNFIN